MDKLITALKKTVTKHIGLQITSLSIINAVDHTDETIGIAKQLIQAKQYHKLKDIFIKNMDADSLVICDVELINGTRFIALVIEPLELYVNGYVESMLKY